MKPSGATAKRFRLGTHRTRTPAETWARLTAVLPVVGITRMAEVTELDCLGIPVFQAIRPASRNLSVSQGKGATRDAARVSAAMEGLELWHAEDLAHLPDVVAATREMEYGNRIQHDTLPWIADATPLDAAPIRWLEARSLVTGDRGWLPREMVELDFRVRTVFEPSMFVSNSIGMGSGNCLEEALLHGLCELVEHHSLHLAHLERPRPRRIDPASVTSDYCRDLVERFRSSGMKLAVYNVSWKVGLPCVRAELVGDDLPVTWHGSGCHPDAEVALSRALTEAAQSRLTYIAGAREDLVPLAEGLAPNWAFGALAPPERMTSFEELPSVASACVAEDLALLVERMASLGFEPFWVDLSRDPLDFSVVRTFAPGLRDEPAH